MARDSVLISGGSGLPGHVVADAMLTNHKVEPLDVTALRRNVRYRRGPWRRLRSHLFRGQVRDAWDLLHAAVEQGWVARDGRHAVTDEATG